MPSLSSDSFNFSLFIPVCKGSFTDFEEITRFLTGNILVNFQIQEYILLYIKSIVFKSVLKTIILIFSIFAINSRFPNHPQVFLACSHLLSFSLYEAQ